MTTITTLTMNPTLEVSLESDEVVADRKVRCGRPLREAGGGGIAVARAIVRLGGSARAIFAAGGLTGARLTVLVAEGGVEAYPIETAGETRETIHITERTSGAPFHFVGEGPALEEAEWKGVLEAVASLDPPPRYLVASGSLPAGVPDDFYGRVSGIAAERRIRLVVDTAGPPLRHAAGPGTFLLKPNLTEARELMGGAPGFSDFFLEGAVLSGVAAGSAAVLAPGTELCRREDAERLAGEMRQRVE